MALSKIQAESMNLADTYAFSGTVSGVGMDLLLDDTISSAVSEYDISSTYINSTYDTYHLVLSLHPATDSRDLYGRFFVGGSIDDGTNYGYEGFPADGGSVFTSDSADVFRFYWYGTGNYTGEGIIFYAQILNVNFTVFPCGILGQTFNYGTSGTHFFNNFGTAFKQGSNSKVVNGLRLYFSSGNIEFGNIQLYGVRT